MIETRRLDLHLFYTGSPPVKESKENLNVKEEKYYAEPITKDLNILNGLLQNFDNPEIFSILVDFILTVEYFFEF